MKKFGKNFPTKCCVINLKKIKLKENFTLLYRNGKESEKGKINTSNIKLYKEVKNGFTYFKAKKFFC